VGLWVAHTVRLALLRAEGVHISARLTATCRPRLYVLLAIATSGFFYIVLAALNAPPITSTAANGSATGVPCAIARTSEYVAAHCVMDPLSTTYPGLLCHDGGFEGYRSAYDACEASHAFHSLVVTSFSVFILWMTCFVLETVLVLSQSRGRGGTPSRLPRVRQLATIVLVGTGAMSVGVCLSVLFGVRPLRPSNPLVAPIFNLGGGASVFMGLGTGIILLNIEAILDRFGALVAGTELPTRVDGRPSTIRAELERIVGRGAAAATTAGGGESKGTGSGGGGGGGGGRSCVSSDGRSSAAASGGGGGGGSSSSKFVYSRPNELVMGKAKDAAMGVDHYLRVGNYFRMPSLAEGVAAIEGEVNAHGTDEDKDNLEYILRGEAGASERVFPNGNLKRDCGKDGQPYPHRKRPDGTGKRFEDFVLEAQKRTEPNEPGRESPMKGPHVLALRLYTTSTFVRLNRPLRDRSPDAPQHPMPITIHYLIDGIKFLRAAAEKEGNESVDLFRGMKDVAAPEDFMRLGGTELAPMSTTTSLDVAVAYARSHSSLIFKISTKSFLERGADLAFLSAFPGEAEFLLPPLTCLRPTGRTQAITFEDADAAGGGREGGGAMKYTVVEVEPMQ
jgi:hypothetical protein